MFDFLRKKPRTFVTDEQYRENKSAQLSMSPQTLEQLRDLGVTENRSLSLEFFFYTNTPTKAKALHEKLLEKGYSCNFGPAAGEKGIQVIKGWTTPIVMSSNQVMEWTESMCNLGYQHDCEFDGWGTNPEQ